MKPKHVKCHTLEDLNSLNPSTVEGCFEKKDKSDKKQSSAVAILHKNHANFLSVLYIYIPSVLDWLSGQRELSIPVIQCIVVCFP